MAIFGLILGGLTVQSIDSSLKTDWISSAIFGFLFFIYYSDLTQKIDNTTTLLNRRCCDSFTDAFARADEMMYNVKRKAAAAI